MVMPQQSVQDSRSLVVQRVPLSDLHLDPANARTHNEPNLAAITASLQRFGQAEPLVVHARTGRVIGGNGRLVAMLALGWKECDVVQLELSDIEATALGIALNRTGELAGWDAEALAKLLGELRTEGALEGVGYSSQDIDELLAEIAANQTSPMVMFDPGPGEDPVRTICARGDVWRLGEHRLLCGDSTNADDVARVLGGEKATLLSTDPPYCVNYTGNDRPIHDGKPSGKDWSLVYREIDIADLGEFLDKVMLACLPHLEHRTPIYIWHAHVQQPTIAAVFERHGLLLHQMIVWVKPSAVFGHSYYRWRHEPCAFGWVKGDKPQHGIGQLDTVWEADWDGKARFSTFHPTSKPTRLFEIPMEQHTRPGGVVLEPFSGSGSQILAGEKLHRRVRAIEIPPAFVDGTILRWQKMTSRAATLDGDGRTYEEISAERSAAKEAS